MVNTNNRVQNKFEIVERCKVFAIDVIKVSKSLEIKTYNFSIIKQ